MTFYLNKSDLRVQLKTIKKYWKVEVITNATNVDWKFEIFEGICVCFF